MLVIITARAAAKILLRRTETKQIQEKKPTSRPVGMNSGRPLQNRENPARNRKY